LAIATMAVSTIHEQRISELWNDELSEAFYCSDEADPWMTSEGFRGEINRHTYVHVITEPHA